jgi:hypothetical protein
VGQFDDLGGFPIISPLRWGQSDAGWCKVHAWLITKRAVGSSGDRNQSGGAEIETGRPLGPVWRT